MKSWEILEKIVNFIESQAFHVDLNQENDVCTDLNVKFQ